MVLTDSDHHLIRQALSSALFMLVLGLVVAGLYAIRLSPRPLQVLGVTISQP